MYLPRCQAGYFRQTAVDISEVAMRQMSEKLVSAYLLFGIVREPNSRRSRRDNNTTSTATGANKSYMRTSCCCCCGGGSAVAAAAGAVTAPAVVADALR